jgi:hypothetical protein
MRRRTLTTLTLFAALALTLGWLPNSSWLRGTLGSLLVDAAASADATLGFAAISGYAWRGLTLTAPRLVADGVDVTATSVSIDWFLPALLVGELPLRLDVVGLAGDVQLGRLTLPAADEGPVADPLDPTPDEDGGAHVAGLGHACIVPQAPHAPMVG